MPTAIDPCQLLTSDEASQLTGHTFGPGKEETLDSNAKICTYGANTKNVFMVELAIAPDVATAQAEEQAAEADVKANAAEMGAHGVKVTKLPGFAPGADAALVDATIQVQGHTIGGRAIYVLRGTTFFGFSDLVLDGAPPSAADVKDEAMTLLGRLP